MSCCGQKTSENVKAIQALFDKAWELEESGRDKDATMIFEALGAYYEEYAEKKKKDTK